MTPAATPTDHPPGHEPRRLPGWLVWTLALAAAALLIERPAILAALLQGLPAECVVGGAELIGWQQGPAEVSAFFANGDSWSGDLLLAADGIFSRVAPRLAPQHRLQFR